RRAEPDGATDGDGTGGDREVRAGVRDQERRDGGRRGTVGNPCDPAAAVRAASHRQGIDGGKQPLAPDPAVFTSADGLSINTTRAIRTRVIIVRPLPISRPNNSTRRMPRLRTASPGPAMARHRRTAS